MKKEISYGNAFLTQKGEGNNQESEYYYIYAKGDGGSSIDFTVYGEWENLQFLRTFAKLSEKVIPTDSASFFQRLNLFRIDMKHAFKARFLN